MIRVTNVISLRHQVKEGGSTCLVQCVRTNYYQSLETVWPNTKRTDHCLAIRKSSFLRPLPSKCHCAISPDDKRIGIPKICVGFGTGENENDQSGARLAASWATDAGKGLVEMAVTETLWHSSLWDAVPTLKIQGQDPKRGRNPLKEEKE